MAHQITGASLEGHITRLNGVNSHHPFEGQTFCDWATQAGDTVTVVSDGQEYKSPLHSTKLVWRGAQTMGIVSGGLKTREAISKISRRKYRRGGTSVRSEEKIYREFTSSDGLLHSAILMTESVLRTEFDNAISDVHSTIEQTAEHIYSEVYASESSLYSYVEQTATYISSHVENALSGIGSEILQTANQIRTEVHAANSLLYSYVDQTATSITSHVESVESSLGSAIQQTASAIRADVYANNSTIYSTIEQTADRISSEVVSAESRMGSAIQQTASAIRADVYANNSEIYSTIEQTAESISSEVVSAESRMGSAILQTANQIRTDVYAANSTIYSTIDQTAYNIRQQVRSTASDLQSAIDQQADKISLVVSGEGANASIKAAEIVASINNGSSSIQLNADHVNISGTTKLNNVMTVIDDAVGFTKPVICSDNIDINSRGALNTYTINLAGSNPVQLTALTMANAIKSASVSNNTLTLTPFIGNPITFSKATQQSGGWSGGNFPLTVSATQQNGNTTTTVSSYVVGFGGPNSGYDTKLELTGNGSATIDPDYSNMILVPVKVAEVQSAYSEPVTRYTKNLSVSTSGLMQQKSVTSNGEVTADEGYIGLSKVTVNVEGVGDVTLSGAWDGSTFTAHSTPAATNEISTTISSDYQQDYGVNYIVVKGSHPSGMADVVVNKYVIGLNTGSVNSTTGKRNVIVTYKGSNTLLMYECQDYKNGWDAAFAKVVWPPVDDSHSFMRMYAPDSTLGSDTYHAYSLDSDADYVYIVRNGDVYAKAANSGAATARTDGYTAGWTAAYNSVYINYPTAENLTDDYISVPVPSGTVDGTPTYYKYYVVGDSSGVFIRFSTTAGTKVAKASIPVKAGITYYTSTVAQTITSGQYLAGNQIIAAVTTDNIAAPYIKYNVTVRVGDDDDDSRIKSVTGTFTSDGTAVAGDILSGKIAYSQGNKITGTIASKAAATYYTSTTAQTISAGQYLSGAQTIAAVTTDNISAPYIKYNVTVKVGDSGNATRIKSVTGSFTSDGTAAAGDILSGKIAYSQGNKITGNIASKAAATYYTSTGTQSIAAGQYLSGAQSIAAVTTSNITAANIKTGVNIKVGDSGSTGRIANVTGTFTSDATAAAGNILSGKTAYVNGSKITGTIASKAAATYYTSTSTQSIAAGQYLSGAQSIAAVSTANISAANIKYGVTIKVGDSGNAGRIANVTGTFTSDGTVSAGNILSGYVAYSQGNKVTGTISSKASATYYTSTSTQSIAAGQYLSGAQSIAAVSTANISAANIKYNVNVKVGDSGNTGRIANVTGTFTSDGTAAAGDMLSGRIAYVKGSKITGTIGSKASATYYTSTGTQSIAAGQYLSGIQYFAAVTTSNISAANIKSGVNVKVGDGASSGRIANVTGTFTSDATASAGTILNGYTAYVNGSKITGSADWDARYRQGYIDGWAGYFSDSHWQKDYYNSSTQKYECWIPAKTVSWTGSAWSSSWDYSSGNNGWFQYTNSSGGGSTASYTAYTLYVSSRTQSSDGYHYTFTIGTGWAAPFASAGSTQTLYKKN